MDNLIPHSPQDASPLDLRLPGVESYIIFRWHSTIPEQIGVVDVDKLDPDATFGRYGHARQALKAWAEGNPNLSGDGTYLVVLDKADEYRAEAFFFHVSRVVDIADPPKKD